MGVGLGYLGSSGIGLTPGLGFGRGVIGTGCG